MEPAAHGDGHVLAVTVALIGRSDLYLAEVFWRGQDPIAAILLIALTCGELDNFAAVIFTKENVAAKARGGDCSSLDPPVNQLFFSFGCSRHNAQRLDPVCETTKWEKETEGLSTKACTVRVATERTRPIKRRTEMHISRSDMRIYHARTKSNRTKP